MNIFETIMRKRETRARNPVFQAEIAREKKEQIGKETKQKLDFLIKNLSTES